MEISVDNVVQSNSDNVVYFSTEFGSAKAYWCGSAPDIDSLYRVEIDINEELEWDKTILKSNVHKYSIQSHRDSVCFTGILDSIDIDNYAVLRMGCSIIPFIAKGEAFAIGEYIRIAVKSISIYPVE